MDKFMQWFKSNGDHFLNQVSILLLGGTTTGLLGPTWKYSALVTVILSALHTIFIPDQPAPLPVPKPPVAPSK